MILTIGHTKGGVAKSTIAINLAVMRAAEGRDVLLVDADEQGSSIAFTELRTDLIGHAGYTSINLHGAAVRTQVRNMATKYDDILIDAGGRDTTSLRAALVVSDMILVPVQPRTFDIWALDPLVELVREAREINPSLRAVAVLTIADPQGHTSEDAATALAQIPELDLLDTIICRRKVFPNAAAQGKAITEMKDPKAIAEMQALMNAVFVGAPVAR